MQNKNTCTFLLFMMIAIGPIILNNLYGQDGCNEFIDKIDNRTLTDNIKEFNYFDETPECAKRIALILSKKAKKKGDSLNLSKVYACMAYRAEAEHSLQYADSLEILNNDPDDYYYYDVNIIKGYIHYYLEEPLEALKEFHKSFRLGISENNFKLETLSLIWIAQLKGEQTNSYQSLQIYNEALESINGKKWKTGDEGTKLELKTEVLESILLYYINNKIKDSTEFYLNEFKKVHKKHPSKSFENKIPIWEGKLAFFKKDYDLAYDLLNRSRHAISGTTLLDITYTLGTIRGMQGNSLLKTNEFIKFDSIYKNDSLPPIPESKEVYMYLMNWAINNRDISKQQEYLKNLTFIDSFLLKNKKEANILDIPGYSVDELRKERAELLEENSHKNSITIIMGLIVLIVMGILVNYYYKFKKAKKTLSDYLDNIDTQIVVKQNTKPIAKDNSQEPAIEIALHKLNSWEESKGYLDKDVDLGVLANMLRTNRTYISKAINIHKGKNFRNYITDLRMDHFIKTTRNNYNYKNKSISKIIEEFGFNSTDTFNRALKAKLKNNNITPSMYMEEIIKRNT